MLKNKKLLEGNINFILFVAIVLAIMIFAQKINYKLDLTPNKTFTLSKLSKELVKSLEDPLIVKVFISKDLPNNYKNIETGVIDVLSEYSRNSKNFTYTIYNCTIKDAERSKKIKENIAEAERYEVYPLSLRDIERNEIKLVNGYLTMVIEYGNMIEKLDILQNHSQLEYALTKILYQIENKINKFYTLPEKIKVDLYLSQNIGKQVKEIEELVKEKFLKSQEANLGQLAYSFKSVFDTNDQFVLSTVKANAYQMRKSANSYAVIVLQNGKSLDKIELLERKPSLDLSKGTITYQYGLINLDNLDNLINEKVEKLLQINDDIAYLNDKETLSLTLRANPLYGFSQPNQQAQGESFYNALNELYNVNLVKMSEVTAQESALIVAGAKSTFSDWDLLQIDQFLLKGGNLIIFRDPYKDFDLGQNNPQMRGRMVPVPNDDGLDKLLSYYGVTTEDTYVFDTNSVKNIYDNRLVHYFQAPIIKKENINYKDFPFLKNIKSFWAFEMGKLALDESAFSNHQAKAIPVFSSGKNAWLNKQANRQGTATPPAKPSDYAQYPLAYLLKGKFKSYFHDKDISKIKPEDEEKNDDQKESKNTTEI